MMEDAPVEWMELDEAIADLEALENRTCEGCKYFDYINVDSVLFCKMHKTMYCDVGFEYSFCCNNWEAK